MADKSNRKITYPQSDGFLQGLILRIKLILRLIGRSAGKPATQAAAYRISSVPGVARYRAWSD